MIYRLKPDAQKLYKETEKENFDMNFYLYLGLIKGTMFYDFGCDWLPKYLLEPISIIKQKE